VTCRINKTNVIPSRVLWNRLLDKTFVLYEYGATNDEEFLASMERLGFDKQTVATLMENEDA
jgi:hypothetical protein